MSCACCCSSSPVPVIGTKDIISSSISVPRSPLSRAAIVVSFPEKWLTFIEGERGANRIIIEDTEHRHEIDIESRRKARGIETAAMNMLRKKKIEKTNEIEIQVRSLQESLDDFLKSVESIVSKHKSLQHIFEVMFPDFLHHLQLR